MTVNYARHVSKRLIPQTSPISPKQVKNSAGGYVFKLDPFKALERFLILGTEGGTYYASERKLTKKNGDLINALLVQAPLKVIDTIVQISDAGRAPKNDPAIFALAVAASSDFPEVRKEALKVLPKVCRIPTHLFHFAEFCDELRGWGKGLRKAIGEWYNTKEPKRLAEYIIKYQQRDGWSHRDLLRLAHPKPRGSAHGALFQYAVKGEFAYDGLENVAIVEGFERVKKATCAKQVAELIGKYKLTREMIPTEFLNKPEVWDALLQDMPPEATIRNLGKMTAVGLLGPLSDAGKIITQRLHDKDHLKKARIHPFKVLIALKTYANGHGEKGSLSWTPNPKVVEALDDAFYLAFDNLEPTGKKIFIGVDVSGSMSSGNVGGLPLTPREAAAAMAMVFVKTEDYVYVQGFDHGLRDLGISSKDSLKDVVRRMSINNGGGTDCALPVLSALKNNIPVDAFITITDNETWAGPTHASEALRAYRKIRPAKQIVMGVTATDFTIADPADPDSLDVVGMDTAVPSVVTDFIRG